MSSWIQFGFLVLRIIWYFISKRSVKNEDMLKVKTDLDNLLNIEYEQPSNIKRKVLSDQEKLMKLIEHYKKNV